MAKAGDVKFDLKIDKRAVDFFQRHAPQKLTEARKKAVEAAGMVWADTAKQITRDDDHIVTGLYLGSIGYATGIATESDVIHQLHEESTKTTLQTGSNVAYAASLEKRFNILARAIDAGESRMQTVAQTQVKKVLFG